jgi:hypothetical protein
MALRAKFGSRILPAAVVAGLGYANWVVVSEPIDAGPLMPNTAQSAATGIPLAPVNTPKQVALADLSETLTRPLFYPMRHPLSKTDNSLAITAAAVQVVDPAKPDVSSAPNADLRLVGILRNDESVESVLIQSGTGSPARWQTVGGEIDGWRVTGISADYVVVESSGTKVVLKLHSGSTTVGTAQ